MTTLQEIGVSALFNIGITSVFLLGFIVFSVQPINDRVYYPKLYLKGIRKRRPYGPPQLKHRGVYFNMDIYQYLRVFHWARSALRKTEEEIIKHAGLDSAVYLHIYLVGLKIFVPVMILGFAILVPINVGGGASVNSDWVDSSIDRLSMSNVSKRSMRLWAHLVMSYVFTAWTCFILFMEYKSIVALRLSFLKSEKRRPDQFTVMVRQVPDVGKEPISTRVESYFLKNHPDSYLTHQMAYNATKLHATVKKRDAAQNWLVYFQVKHSHTPSTRPTTKTGFCGLFGQQVDAIEYYTTQIEKLTEQVTGPRSVYGPASLFLISLGSRLAEAERELIMQDPKATMPAAFVSFKTRWGAAVCAQTQQNQDPTIWLTDWAPEPRDVVWANLAIPHVELGFRSLAMGVVVFLLVFFYMIPIVTVQSLANLQGIQKISPSLDGFVRKRFVSLFVQGFLPGLILKAFLWLLPRILMVVSKIEGHLAISKLERRAAAKFYYFMVVNVFFGSILSGSAFQQLKTFVSSTTALGFVQALAKSIPQRANFFITYIMLDAWSIPAGELLRFWPLIMYHIRNFFFVKTERDRLRATSPGTISLDESLPQLELYFLMGLVYSVISPVIVPFIVLFFGFGFVVYRHQIYNVYDPTYESAGAFWPHVHGRIIAALILEHLTLIGMFLVQGPVSFVKVNTGTTVKRKVLGYLSQACSSAPFIIALPILTLYFHVYCKSRFEPAFKHYPLEDAMEKDTVEKEKEPDLNLAVFLRNAYKNPDFSDEKEGGADLEKGQEQEEDIEDSKTPLQGSLPRHTDEEEYVDLEDDDDISDDEDDSPLTFRWGAFFQAQKEEEDNQMKSSLSCEASNSESVGSPLTFMHGWFYDGPDAEVSSRKILCRISTLCSSDRALDLESPGSPLIFRRGTFYQSDEEVDSVNRGFSHSSTLGSVTGSLEENPSPPLVFRRGTFYQDDDTDEESKGSLRRYYSSRDTFGAGNESPGSSRLQVFYDGSHEDELGSGTIAWYGGSLKGCLSRASTIGSASGHSDSESIGSPLIFRRGFFYEDYDEDEGGIAQTSGDSTKQDHSQSSFFINAKENSGSESPGSPLIFRWGTFYAEKYEDEGKDVGSTSIGDSQGANLKFRKGRFYEDDVRSAKGGRAPSPVEGTKPLSRARTIGALREISDSKSHSALKGVFSRAKTIGTVREVSQMRPSSPRLIPEQGNLNDNRNIVYLQIPEQSKLNEENSKDKEREEVWSHLVGKAKKSKLSRAKTLDTVREVSELELSSSSDAKFSRAKTLGAILKHGDDTESPGSHLIPKHGQSSKQVHKDKEGDSVLAPVKSTRKGIFGHSRTVAMINQASGLEKPTFSRANTLSSLFRKSPDRDSLNPPKQAQMDEEQHSERDGDQMLLGGPAMQTFPLTALKETSSNSAGLESESSPLI